MSNPQNPKPVKLVISLFMREKGLLHPVAEYLTDNFGPVDLIGPWLSFDFTDYYRSEMGRPLFRRMLAFRNLIEQEQLAEIKVASNRLEQQYSSNNCRAVNIDPGYLMHERFVLASAKNFAHRIYIGKRIYADLTLIYTQGAFQTLPWTYPDYAEKEMLGFLERVRNKYLFDMKNLS
jgi:hypothetical protein